VNSNLTYYKQNKEKILEKARAKMQENLKDPEWVAARKEYMRQYYKKNKEDMQPKQSAWRKRNPEKIKLYQENHKPKAKIYRQRAEVKARHNQLVRERLQKLKKDPDAYAEHLKKQAERMREWYRKNKLKKDA